jgi:hypothetical protein
MQDPKALQITKFVYIDSDQGALYSLFTNSFAGS